MYKWIALALAPALCSCATLQTRLDNVSEDICKRKDELQLATAFALQAAQALKDETVKHFAMVSINALQGALEACPDA